MADNISRLPLVAANTGGKSDDSRNILQSQRSNELFFAVVGPVGAGGSRAISSLKRACEAADYKCEWIKASDLIRTWATSRGLSVPSPTPKSLATVRTLQDLGDMMRKEDPAAIARSALAEIARRRAVRTGMPFVKGQAVIPGLDKVVYLIDSIRHPAETILFRRTYANAFALIGVVCEETERRKRILGKYFTVPEQRLSVLIAEADAFIKRDANDEITENGQHVTAAFFEADFFVDNTIEDEPDTDQRLDEPLSRLISIISHDRLIRPFMDETAMHHAHSARVRSACLSRQVGAALVGSDGTVVATGTNEVPRAGGGVYGEHTVFPGDKDHRCAFRPESYCSSNREQNRIIDELIDTIPALIASGDRATLRKAIRSTSVGQLIEFSRAVHAEMDALLSAGREGVSTVGTRLFVTTFPCHYCARHIVSAGVYEVQFIEPYPKSLALHLHRDAITTEEGTWLPPEEISMATRRRLLPSPAASAGGGATQDLAGKVLFKPFVGVAPRLYLRAFEKTRRLKDNDTGAEKFDMPLWGNEWAPFVAAYPALEAVLGQ